MDYDKNKSINEKWFDAVEAGERLAKIIEQVDNIKDLGATFDETVTLLDKLGTQPMQVTDNQPFEKGIAYAKP